MVLTWEDIDLDAAVNLVERSQDIRARALGAALSGVAAAERSFGAARRFPSRCARGTSSGFHVVGGFFRDRREQREPAEAARL
jgi:hypothetical protein